MIKLNRVGFGICRSVVFSSRLFWPILEADINLCAITMLHNTSKANGVRKFITNTLGQLQNENCLALNAFSISSTLIGLVILVYASLSMVQRLSFPRISLGSRASYYCYVICMYTSVFCLESILLQTPKDLTLEEPMFHKHG